jgi:endonuclease/exonuclease/phosphatase family metal-dependent hydrolase
MTSPGISVRVAAMAGLGMTLAACAAVISPTTAPVAACRDARAHDVVWVHAPDETDRPSLDAWCAGVGPVVLDAPAIPLASHAADSVLVITWNVRVGGGDIAAFVTDLRRGRLNGGVAVDHFVLLIQEAYRAGGAVPALQPGARTAGRIAAVPPDGERADIVTTAAELGLHVFYVPSMRNGAAGIDSHEDRGNAILSTLPLSDPAAIELPYEAQRRVVAAATVDVPTSTGQVWPLRFASMHLDNRSRLARGLATLGPGRGRQARALVQALAADPIAVVGGDVNAWAFGPFEVAPRILRRFFADAAEHDGKPTHFAAGLGWRLDELFFRGTRVSMAGAERVDDRYGSDHHAVMAWVRFAADG